MRAALCLALAGLALIGCAAEDPDTRPGMWRPIKSNDANLRAMIADPQDLLAGAADPRADGAVIAAAVTRYRSGKVKDLPEVSISKVAPISTTNSSSDGQ